LTEIVIDNENLFKVHFKSAATEFKEFFERTMKWVIWFYSDEWRRWMKSEEYTEFQTLQMIITISCQLKRIQRWFTLIQRWWKWVQKMSEDHK